MNNSKKAFFKELLSLLIIALAGFIYALGINLFLSPNQIPPGGFAGLGIMVNYLYGWPIGIFILILNVPLLLLSIRSFGFKIILKTLISTAIMAFFIDLCASFSSFTNDRLMAAIYGGVLTGTGLGLMMANGSTSGGSDILAYHLQRLLKIFSIGKILLAIDVIVIGTSALVFGDIEIALYAGIAKTISTKVVDAIVSGFNYAKTAMIITEKPEVLTKAIFKFLHHGVTKFEATGMFTGDSKSILMVVVKRYETYTLKKIIHRIDPKAFIILNDSSEVLGKGFKAEDTVKRHLKKIKA